MRRLLLLAVIGAGALAGTGRSDEYFPLFRLRRPPAAQPDCPPVAPIPPAQPTPADPTTPPPPAPDPTATAPADNPLASPFAQPTEGGGFASRSFNENFDGDNVGVFYRRRVTVGFATVPQFRGFTTQVVGTNQVVTTTLGATTTVPGTTTTVRDPVTGQLVTVTGPPTVVTGPSSSVITFVPVTTTTPVVGQQVFAVQRVVQYPLAGRYSGIQIVDNDSPRPTDRVYFGYNFYSNVGASLNPGIGGTDVQRQTAGFEKTFLDGDASVGLRLPFVQQYGPFGVSGQDVGDLTILFKYAILNDRDAGNLISTGLLVTTPTGANDGVVLADGSAVPHSVLLQPWAGFVRTFGRGYVQGISNLIVPTDGRDVTLWGNSLGAGYRLYSDPNARLLTAITPVAEVHVRTPLNNRDSGGLIYMQDQVNANAGVHFRFNRASLSGAVSIPLVGPRPWDVEALTYLNYQF